MAKFSFAHRARTSWPRWCRDGHTRAPIAEHLARTSGRPMEVIDCGYSGAWQPCAFVVLPDLLPDVPLSRRTTRAVVRSRR